MMKSVWLIVLYVLRVFICFSSISCQDIKWKWLAGSKSMDPSQTASDPGGRSGATQWVQSGSTIIWAFGGEYFQGNKLPGLKNDLWQLELPTFSWKMMHSGSAANMSDVPKPRHLGAGCGISGAYFIVFGGYAEGDEVLGDSWLFYIPEKKWYSLQDLRSKLGGADKSNEEMPSARGDMAVWCDSDSLMYVFGGFDSNQELLHDMWVFDLQELSWQQLPSSSRLPSDPDFVKHLQYPNGRSGSTTWVTEDTFYMFGGNIQAGNIRSKHLNVGYANDMWAYDRRKDEWTFLFGLHHQCNTAGRYGKLGTPADDNLPGCRRRAAGWIDTRENLWMFGGDGVDDDASSISVFSHAKLLSDVWHFDTKRRRWSWKGGEQTGDQRGRYGAKGVADADNLPGSRCESVVFSADNILMLFGGVGHDGAGVDGYLDDVWSLDVHADNLVMRNGAYPGPVFGLIFLGVSMVTVIAVGYCLSRGLFKDKEKEEENRGKYRRLEDMETTST